MREETSSNVRRKETWQVLKLMRARSPLSLEKGGNAGGAADLASGSRWSAGAKPCGLAVKRKSGGHPGNRLSAAGSEVGLEERSPGAWGAETGFRGSKG
jgi:hypothetical protein